ncbi:citrulline utilization hydrolase CtlX [Persicobacter psychrovividus]|uniref:Amidinotransferase n=1 Tax=Persicobacter psychrovividus TaxID=387638 RepID=A0ABM7VDV0_9BACT|nr:hypothetical protein PEPS_13910 [Persicobacter psychrovividus]
MKQTPNTVMMMRPVRFGFNEQTAGSNAFQSAETSLSVDEIQERALAEFDAFVARLRAHGVKVMVVQDTPEPHTPDSIFPNNWISFHEDGRVVLYPMMADNRRQERRMDVFTQLQEEFGFRIQQIIDVTDNENQGEIVEGTGSIIFDYPHQLAYANRSDRTTEKLFFQICERLGFEGILFDALDKDGNTIYHTNVVMALGDKFAVICGDVIPTDQERELVFEKLRNSGHEIVTISYDQMIAFAGNMLQVENEKGETFLLMSQSSFDVLTATQKATLEKYTNLLPMNVNTIEQFGGGSVRCMVAGVHLPK